MYTSSAHTILYTPMSTLPPIMRLNRPGFRRKNDRRRLTVSRPAGTP